MDRRQFIKSGSLGLATTFMGQTNAFASSPTEKRIYNAVKWTMIKNDLPVLDKFKMSKDVGFDGVSLMAPGWFEVKEVLQGVYILN